MELTEFFIMSLMYFLGLAGSISGMFLIFVFSVGFDDHLLLFRILGYPLLAIIGYYLWFLTVPCALVMLYLLLLSSSRCCR